MKRSNEDAFGRSDNNTNDDSNDNPSVWEYLTNVVSDVITRLNGVNERDSQGNTVLHRAIKNNDWDAFEKWVNHPKMILNQYDYSGETLLATAIRLGRKQMIATLIEKGATSNNPNESLCRLVEKGDIDNVELFLKKGHTFYEDQHHGTLYNPTPLHRAVQLNNVALVEMILKYKPHWKDKVVFTIGSPLHVAVANKQLPMVELLKKHGANSNTLNDSKPAVSPYGCAVLRGDGPMIKALMTDPDSFKIIVPKNNMSFLEASLMKPEQYPGLADHVLALHNAHYGFNTLHLPFSVIYKNRTLDVKGSILHWAIQLPKATRLAVVRFLHEKGVDLETKIEITYNGVTRSYSPRALAIFLDAEEVAEFLIPLTKQSEERTLDGLSLLHHCVVTPYRDLIQPLIKSGAKPDEVTSNGDLMQIALDNDDGQTAALFLPIEDQINELDQDGYSLLHVAALHGNQKKVELLVSHGAQVNILTKENKTPLDLAVTWGHKDTAIYLLKKEARTLVSCQVNEAFLALSQDEKIQIAANWTSDKMPDRFYNKIKADVLKKLYSTFEKYNNTDIDFGKIMNRVIADVAKMGPTPVVYRFKQERNSSIARTPSIGFPAYANAIADNNNNNNNNVNNRANQGASNTDGLPPGAPSSLYRFN